MTTGSAPRIAAVDGSARPDRLDRAAAGDRATAVAARALAELVHRCALAWPATTTTHGLRGGPPALAEQLEFAALGALQGVRAARDRSPVVLPGGRPGTATARPPFDPVDALVALPTYRLRAAWILVLVHGHGSAAVTGLLTAPDPAPAQTRARDLAESYLQRGDRDSAVVHVARGLAEALAVPLTCDDVGRRLRDLLLDGAGGVLVAPARRPALCRLLG